MSGWRLWRGWRGWKERSQVERVDLYTRQSLYVLTWFFPVFLLAQEAPDLGSHPRAAVAVLVGTVVLVTAATVLLRDVISLYPDTWPLPWQSVGPFLVLVVLACAGAYLLPSDLRLGAGLVIYYAVTWACGGLRHRGVLVTLVVGGAGLAWLASGEVLLGLAGALVSGFFAFTTRTSLWLSGVVRELDRARSAQAALAVAEERLRFSHDVHDVLGRRLSTIAVQAELAATLSGRDDERAAAQMLEVRGIAHEALREARELARGYREANLDRELVGARSLLRSAGIEVELDVDDLPEAWHEAAAWVVRETVTNLLRHSSASQVTIRYAAPTLSVVNDGVTTAPGGTGLGLAGLRERLQPLGARLGTTYDDGRFAVTATFPPPEGAGVST